MSSVNASNNSTNDDEPNEQRDHETIATIDSAVADQPEQDRIDQMDRPVGDDSPKVSDSAEQPAEHWAQNAENLRKFWSRAKSILIRYELPDDPHDFVHRVAEVDSLKQYPGTGADLIQKIELEAYWLQPEPKPYKPLDEAAIRRKFNQPQKGKPYLTVPGRILLFKLKHPTGSIDTELIRFDADIAVFKATIRDDQGSLLATGYGTALAESTQHLGQKHLQMAETNAVGRALAHAGIGTDMAVADMDEGLARRKGKTDQKGKAAPPPAPHADRQSARRLN